MNSQISWSGFVGLAGLYGLALCGWLSTAGANIGLGMLLLGFVADRRAWRVLRQEPVAWLTVALVLYWVGRAAWGVLELPVNRHAQWDALGDWLYLTLFIPVAWWLGGDRRRLDRVWLLVATGLIGGMLIYLMDPEHLQALLDGERSGFQLRRPIAFGLYSGTVLLGLLMLAPRCWGDTGPGKFGRIALWLVAVLLLTQGMLATHSRGAWLAALLIVPLTLAVRYRSGFSVRVWRASWRAALLATLALGVLVWMNEGTISKRLHEEPKVVQAIASGDLASAPPSSISYRLRLWIFALEKWRERPFMGWGPGNSEYLIVHSGRPEIHSAHIEYLDHMHNTYLELLVGFGLCGTLLAFALALLLGKALCWSWRQGKLPSDYVIFLGGAFAFMGVWMFFDFRSLHHDWRFYWLMLAGSSYTFYLGRRLEPPASSTSR
ncbi:MAG: O-antigen ligase family protein [Gammaproteobacteria bacterium]|nr:O-antigen ligase family protein [Gammaproteobacteria bacterium]